VVGAKGAAVGAGSSGGGFDRDAALLLTLQGKTRNHAKAGGEVRRAKGAGAP